MKKLRDLLESSSFGLKKKQNVSTAIQAAKDMGHEAKEWVPLQKSPNAAMYSQGAIHINRNHKFWSDPVGNMKIQKAKGHLSSDHPMHLIHHEEGHALYDPPDNFHNQSHREFARQHVSHYAGSNPKEFVSEVHAGMKGGANYSPEVMKVFSIYANKRK